MVASLPYWVKVSRSGSSFSSYTSLDGVNWVTMGRVTQNLSQPRLAIFMGGSASGFPNADLAWVEIISPQAAVASASLVVRPLLPLSALSLSGGEFSFPLPTQPGVQYLIDYKNSLADSDWTPFTNLLGSGFPVRITDPTAPPSSRFYRVRWVATSPVSQ